MRGTYTATYLGRVASAFAQRRGVAALDVGAAFDLIVGISTGGIIACALAAGIPLPDVVELYRKHGRAIFPLRLPDRFGTRLIADYFGRPKALAAGTSLKLTQEVTQPTTGLQPGQSVKRTVTAHMQGASPIVLPQLMPDVRIDGIVVYPDEPSVTEEDDRGLLSGTRTETITLMAEGRATGHVPGIELRWFNVKSGAIETATLDGFDISVEGAPASGPARDRSTLMLVAAGLAALTVLILLIRRIWPRAMDAYRRRRARHRATKTWAERTMLKTIQRHDYQATLHAVDEWASRPPVTDAARIAPVYRALTAIGRSLYGRSDRVPMSSEWRAASEAVKAALAGRPQSAGNGLPPLNPKVARILSE